MIPVGIDVSKSKSTVAVIDSDGQILLKPWNYNHTVSDMLNLISLINSYPQDVKVAMESTSHYHYPILKTLLEENIYISVVNPYLMKKYGDNSIRKGKTDKKDAIRIARYVLEKAYLLKPHVVSDQKYSDLKFLSRQYQQSIFLKTKARIQLNNLLDEIMPSIPKLFASNNAISPTQNLFLDFIEKYESFDKIRNIGEKRFINSFTKFAVKRSARNTQYKALAIYELASDSITTRDNGINNLIALHQCISILRQCT
jgi:transposase